MRLKDIPVRIESLPQGPGQTLLSTGGTGSAVLPEAPPGSMAQALLREIGACLQTVAAGGPRQVIELGNLPIGEAELRLLEEALGHGEVHAQISASGPSTVYETAYPGVWWVKYFNDGDYVVTQQVEVGTVAMILEAHPEDIRDSAARFLSRFPPHQDP
jgi:hydrogenase-1 operon protein HyaF